MKLLIMSDLHNEFEPTSDDVAAVASADIVVLVTSIRKTEASRVRRLS